VLAALVVAALAAQNPPAPGPLDVPVFVDTAFGVSLARPADDWVFEPARVRGTTTVIFTPRGAALSDQLWGVLVLTTFRAAVRLGDVADQRVAVWQAMLGPTFQVLARDSLALDGQPAVHLVMTGALSRAVLDVEEYLVARGNDLVSLQFRYPRGLPRDSIALGYERALRGLRIGAPGQPPAPAAGAAPLPERTPDAPAPPGPPTPPAPPSEPRAGSGYVPPPWRQMWSALAHSPWRTERVDATVRLAGPGAPLAVEARLEIVNDGLADTHEVPLFVPRGWTVDSVRSGIAPLRVLVRGEGYALTLPDTVAFQSRSAITVFYRMVPFSRAVAYTTEWLPLIQPPNDSLGHARPVDPQQVTLRFDLPDGLAAIATGRLSTDLLAVGRRRQTWVAEGVAARVPGFVIGGFEAAPRGAGRLALTLWSPPGRNLPLDSCAALTAAAWSFISRAFGAIAAPELTVVVGAPATRGLPGLLLLADSAALDGALVHQELARTWWGGAIRGAGPGSAWIEEALPAWTALAAHLAGRDDSVRTRVREALERAWREVGIDTPLAAVVPASGSDIELLRTKGVVALETMRRAAGNARFREAMRTLVFEHRGGSVSADDFSELFDPTGSVLRPLLYPR
jgi:hypothetical protein